MNRIKDVAERLRGLRDSLNISAEQMASECGIELENYKQYETGDVDIPVSKLLKIANKYGVELTALMFDEESRMNSYFVTREGAGVVVERSKAYSYESLSSGFAHKMFDTFMVTVEPKEGAEMVLNSHSGQEFNYIVEGSMEIAVDGNTTILNVGDSIMFDSNKAHAMRALNDKPVKFIAIITN